MAVKKNTSNKKKKKANYNTKKTTKHLNKNNKVVKKNSSNKKKTIGKNIDNRKKSYATSKKKSTTYKNKSNVKPKKVAKKGIKRSVATKKIDNSISNVELLDKILEESRLKKENRKKAVAHKNQVKSKVVIDLLKKEEENKTITEEKSLKVEKKDDLIITKEIDLADLADYLTRESQIIEQSIDEEIDAEGDKEDLVITKFEKKNKKEIEKKSSFKPHKAKQVKQKRVGKGLPFKLETLFGLIAFIIVLGVIIAIGTKTFVVDDNKSGAQIKKIFVDKKELAKQEEKERKEKEKRFEECLGAQSNDNDTSEEIKNYINDLNNYFSSKYRVSIRYVELNHNYQYSYNTDKDYYAASTIKALDGLYIYSKAAAGEINLDDTMTYTSKYNLASSFYMTKHKYGDEITIRDLVRYAITRSDNRAHQMLVDYIGFNKLKEYGMSLGATRTLIGDIFGSINVDDAIIYWQEINRFIINNGDLGEELKSYFKEADQNFLSVPEENVIAIHKYGEYESYYHDIGIVYAESPYIIAILSTEGRSQYDVMIKDINSKIYELNELYNNNRNEYCESIKAK